jgi:hypothetical protein
MTVGKSQRLAAFEVVHQGLERDARATKNGSAAEHVRVLRDNVIHCRHGGAPFAWEEGVNSLPHANIER